MSAIIGPFPSTLVNGTVEDANQVQTLLNWIQSQVNTNAAAGQGSITRNILLNGGMEVSQRYVATAATIVGTTGYTVDRWQAKTGAGQTGLYTQVSGIGLPQFQYALQVQRQSGSTATTPLYIATSLESIDSYQMQGQTVTLSFRAIAGANFSASVNTVTVQVWVGTGTDENVITGYTGGSVAFEQDIQFTNNWATYQLSGIIPTTTTEVGIMFGYAPFGTAGSADYFQVSGAQLELSPAASSFDFRPFVETYQRCLRYFQKTFGYPFVPAQNTSNANFLSCPATIAGAVNNVGPTILLPSPLRQTPTVVTFNPYAANANARNVTQSADFTITNLNGGVISVRLTGTTPSSTVVGDQLAVHYTLDAEL